MQQKLRTSSNLSPLNSSRKKCPSFNSQLYFAVLICERRPQIRRGSSSRESVSPFVSSLQFSSLVAARSEARYFFGGTQNYSLTTSHWNCFFPVLSYICSFYTRSFYTFLRVLHFLSCFFFLRDRFIYQLRSLRVLLIFLYPESFYLNFSVLIILFFLPLKWIKFVFKH